MNLGGLALLDLQPLELDLDDVSHRLSVGGRSRPEEELMGEEM